MPNVVVQFHGRPGGQLDDRVHQIIEDHGGKVGDTGTVFHDPDDPVRDIKAEVPADRVDSCCDWLRDVGITNVKVD